MKAWISFALAAAVGLAGSPAARAQDAGWGFSAGLKAWRTSWSGFTYEGPEDNRIVTPVQTDDRFVWIPSASVRWGSVVGSISGYPATDFRYPDGDTDRRREADVNVAWLLTPGLAVSAGYKWVSQIGKDFRYRPSGPVLGASASAPLTGTLALYGNLGFGRLQTPGASADKKEVVFDADYQLVEVGLSWTLPVERFVSALNLSVGYRVQVLVSKDAGRDQQVGLDARDITQGFTLGLTARF